jgi:hypothetical protein
MRITLSMTDGLIVPHIFTFGEEGELSFCGPHGTLDRPTRFEGPGMMVLRRNPVAPTIDPRLRKEIEAMSPAQRVVAFLTQAEAAIPAGLLPIRVLLTLILINHTRKSRQTSQRKKASEEITIDTILLTAIAHQLGVG